MTNPDTSELEEILDRHAILYSNTTGDYLTNRISESDRDEKWAAQDNKTKQSLLNWHKTRLVEELEKLKKAGTVENGFMLPLEVLDDRIADLTSTTEPEEQE